MSLNFVSKTDNFKSMTSHPRIEETTKHKDKFQEKDHFKKPMSNIEQFLESMDGKYEYRRNRIAKFCQSLNETKRNEYSQMRSVYHIFVPKLNIAYCAIAKVMILSNYVF